MINEMLELVGFKHGEGQMTTGSSNANMLAMMSSRNEMLPEVKINGLRAGADIYAFVSADAHYSMEKAANILGLGTKRLIKIPVTNTIMLLLHYIYACLRHRVVPWNFFQLNSNYFNEVKGIFPNWKWTIIFLINGVCRNIILTGKCYLKAILSLLNRNGDKTLMVCSN